jgi:predicted N-acetyltransferase YhbS
MARNSKYSAIWQSLKRDKHITLSIVPGLETRIIKALNERKQYDKVFQFEAAEEGHKYRVKHTISDNGRVMKITLYRSIGENDI